MINPFVIKKYGALVLAAMLSVILYTVGNIYYGLWGGIGFLLASLLLVIPLGCLLLKNPFTLMLEGKGLLAINWDSTGILHPFIINLNAPFLFGKLRNKDVNDVFDRSIVSHLAVPEQKGTAKPTKEGGIVIELSQKEYNEARFALFHYPVILYNEQIKSVVTKDFLSEQEKNVFAEHSVLYLNRKMEELTSAMRDFGRYVVDSLKPKTDFFQNTWVRILAIVLLIILVGALVIMIAPKVMATISGAGGNAGSVLSNAKGAITPR